jgi:hypothetical protein
VKLTTSNAEIKNSGAIPPLPYVSSVKHRDNLTFTFTIILPASIKALKKTDLVVSCVFINADEEYREEEEES